DYPAGVVQSSPAISTYYDDGDGEVYIYFTVNSATGGVYCLKDLTNSTSPELVWSYSDKSKTAYTLQGVAISDGWIYFGTDKKYVFGLTTAKSLLPTAAFSASAEEGAVPFTVQFTDNSENATSWAWDFDNDGNVDSNEQNPSYTYTNAGTYTVSLKVTNAEGSDTETKTNYITANGSVQGLAADFSAVPLSGNAPLEVQFTDKSTGAPTSWAWDFDNDGNVDSTDQNPLFTYNVPGVYSVRFNVSNAAGSDEDVKVGFIEVSKSLANSYSTAMNNTNPGAPDPAIPGFVGPDGEGKCLSSGPNNVVNPTFLEWASVIVNYSPANQSIGPQWTDPTKALGPVTGDNFDIVSLGDLDENKLLAGEKPGSVTFGFDVPIANGEGSDLALFENGFITGGIDSTEIFAELAFVEVSTDNITFIRFPAVSLTPGLVGGYGTIEPTNVTNLVGKHVNAYGNSWGTPFDLSCLENMTEVLNGSVDLNNINYVRVVDIPGNGFFSDSQGNPIYDGWVTWGSGGLDLEAVGVINTAYLPMPVAEFSANITSGDAPLEVQFTDKSTGAPTSWAWDFDNDGTVDSTEQNPSHIYNKTGNYTVKLTSSNGNGSDIKEIQDMIKVTEEGQPVISEDTWYQFHKDAQHSGYTDSDAPDSASLAWTAEPLNDTYSLVPSSSLAIAEGKIFGLCNGPTDEMGNPQTSYGQLVAFDENTGEEVWNVTVEAPEWGSWSSPAYDSGKVFASAGKNTYCINASTGEVIWTFNNPTDLASCNGGPSIGDGKVFVSDWDGGNYYCLDESNGALLWTFKVDGIYAQSTPAYKDGKVYLSCWTSTNAVYCVDAETGELVWKNDGFENGPCGSVTVTEDGLYVTVFSFGSSDGIYKLDLTDGHVLWGRSDVSPSDSTPTVVDGKVYLSTGTAGYSELKTYCLDASDGHSLWETNASENIGDWACSSAVADGKVFTGGAASGLFTGSSTLYAFDAETGAQVWSYEGCGCSPAVADGMVFSIGSGKVYAFKESQGSLPEAKFSSNVSSGKAPLTVSFTGESAGDITSWAWDFDNDGTVDSTEQNPVYTYTSAGNYTVNLTVANANGTDSKSATIIVSEKPVAVLPVANFSASPASGKTPLTVAFTDTSTGTPTKWKWSFGDGTSSTQQNPKHKYSKAGKYTITLT
ncbi:PKD domain-containing protein, partial [Methanosarcina spelaei]